MNKSNKMVLDVDTMSDADIRTKLMEFGFPVMPITQTTRKIMIKKLKVLLENKGKGSNDRRSLGRYSSEEESDTDAKVVRNDKNRRVTMAAPPLNSSTARKTKFDNVIVTEQSPILPSSLLATTKRTTTTKFVNKSVQDEFDTGSDSEPEVIEVDDSPRVNSYITNRYKSESPRYGIRDPTSYSTPKSDISSSITTTYSSNISNKPPTPPRFSAFASSSTNDNALDRLNQIRSRLSLGNTAYERPSTYTSSYIEHKADESAETPFLSNFTRRLSQLSSTSPKQEYGFKNDIIKEHDTNGANDYGRPYLLGRSKYRDTTRDYYSRHDSNIVKNNLISFAVLGVALMFFVVVGVMYWGMRSSDSALETSGYSVPFCTSPSQKHGIDCINETDFESTIMLMKAIKPELTKRALNSACTNTVIKPYMAEPDLINYYHKLSGQNIQMVQQQLQLLEILIFKNPEWDISVVQVDSSGEIAQKNILYDMSEVIELRPSKTIALAILNPDVPWKCIFYNKIFLIINTALVLAAGFFVLYCTNLGFKYYKLYRQHQKDEVTNMVERIIDILQNNTSEDADNFLVINHVRDMILPINDRKRMEKAWDQAVKFINENESRVRTEVQVVKGEPFEVWRWISSPSLNTSGSPRSKTWQGQAFETQVGSVNSLPCSPTPCLKIRGMADDTELNVHGIREAVLSKCAHQCRILHCAVDSNSKCVYLKCGDQKEAAVAYRNLHGWWYAGHLVTVKYILLERYMQRFPDSPVSGPPFLKSLSPATDWMSHTSH